MKNIRLLFISFFIFNVAFSNPEELYFFAKNYTSINSEMVLTLFEANSEYINKQDKNGDTLLHIHVRYLLENMYECIDLNLLHLLVINSNLYSCNDFNETPVAMIIDKFYNLEEYESHYNFDKESVRIKLLAFLNCLLSDNWHLDFIGLGFLKKMGCEYFHDLGFYNIVLFLINKIAFNVLSKGLPLYKYLKKNFKYKESMKSDFLDNLYKYACAINQFYND